MAARKKKAAPRPKKKSGARKAPPSAKKKKKKAAPKKAKAAPKKKKAAPRKAQAAPRKKKAAARPSQRATVRLKPLPPDPDKTPVKNAIPEGAGAPLPRPAKPEATGSNRREYLRVPYGAWITLLHQGRQAFCLARDISVGGMFLQADDPPHLGEELKLLIVIENERSPLELHGLVVRRSENEHGFGVRFTGVDSASATRLRDLVADASGGLWRPPHDGGPAAPRDES